MRSIPTQVHGVLYYSTKRMQLSAFRSVGPEDTLVRARILRPASVGHDLARGYL